jgi:hypothetical protein
MSGAEIQHIDIVTPGPGQVGLDAKFIRSGMPRCKVTVYGRTDPGYKVVLEDALTNAEIRGLSLAFARLADIIDGNKDATR